MSGDLAHGGNLLRFFLQHGFIVPARDEGGMVTAYKRNDKLLTNPISIPSGQPIGPGLLKYLLSRGGFTEKEFWDEME